MLGDGGLPSHDTRRWQSGPHLRVSIERLHRAPGSASVPPSTEVCADELGQLGERAKQLGIRLSFHPGVKRGRRVVREPPSPPRSAHADLVDPFAFDRFVRDVVRDARVDVMLEAKGKDLALLRLRDELASLRPDQP